MQKKKRVRQKLKQIVRFIDMKTDQSTDLNTFTYKNKLTNKKYVTVPTTTLTGLDLVFRNLFQENNVCFTCESIFKKSIF